MAGKGASPLLFIFRACPFNAFIGYDFFNNMRESYAGLIFVFVNLFAACIYRVIASGEHNHRFIAQHACLF